MERGVIIREHLGGEKPVTFAQGRGSTRLFCLVVLGVPSRWMHHRGSEFRAVDA